jgi:hypothetical protein
MTTIVIRNDNHFQVDIHVAGLSRVVEPVETAKP